MKYAWIASNKKHWPVSVACEMLGVSTIENVRRKGAEKPSKPSARSPGPPSGRPGLRILAPALQRSRSNSHFLRHNLKRCAFRRQQPRHCLVLE